MISVEEARSLVFQAVMPRSPEKVQLSDALGRVLAVDVESDVDSPPHDKSLVDGYAIQAANITAAPTDLKVIEEVMAGAVPRARVSSGTAIRIMTGAPVPEGADAVVMVEETESIGEDRSASVRVLVNQARVGQHIMRRGTSLGRGEVVLTKGRELRPIEIGLLAEVGATEISVLPRPSVAVLSTGNELVPPNEIPGAGQIRNSNGAMLDALVNRAGGKPVNLGIGLDQREALGRLVEIGLKEDVLVLSGGVSAGVLDLVPAVLTELGVRQVFHKVKLRPGKPLWFGVLPEPSGDSLVFGLPGNPVSSLVCFELFVRPALGNLAGHAREPLAGRDAVLAADHRHRGDRPTFYPVRWQEVSGVIEVAPLRWHGSADLRSLTDANGLAFFAAGSRDYRRGDSIQVFPF